MFLADRGQHSRRRGSNQSDALDLGTPVASTNPSLVAEEPASGAQVTNHEPQANRWVGATFAGERGAWTIVWILVLVGGSNAWGSWWSSPLVASMAILMILGAILGLVWTWVISNPRSSSFQLAALGGVLSNFIFPNGIQISTYKFYHEDASAFVQIAAKALVRGHNPYRITMMHTAAKLFTAPGRFWTYTVNGNIITHLSYPAGSFLFYTIPELLGFRHAMVAWVDFYAWMAATVLIFFLLPKQLRWIVGLLALVSFYLPGFITAGTDPLMVFWTILVVWRWDRYGLDKTAGIARWLGPIALGIDCAIKQTPWFLVPILVIGIAYEAKRRTRPPIATALRYAATAISVFAVINLPFFIWTPSSWFRTTVRPLFGGLIAGGEGIIGLAIHGLVRGVDLNSLSQCAFLADLVAIIVYAIWYPKLKLVWPFFAAVPFYFASRSLLSYFLDFVPAAIVAGLSVDSLHSHQSVADLLRVSRRWMRILYGSLAFVLACTLVVGLLAFSSSPPLSIKVERAAALQSSGDQLFSSVTLEVTNNTTKTISPHYMVNNGTGGTPWGFWTIPKTYPKHLPPHSTKKVVLTPPSPIPLIPHYPDRWLVQAYTTGPTWLSVSTVQTAREIIRPITPPKKPQPPVDGF